MATETTVRLVDDIDGTEAAETVSFGLDRFAYEIDLTTKRAAELRGALAEFVSSARRVVEPAARTRRQQGPAVADPEQTRAKREWARQNGFKVSDRGRIPTEVEEAYNARAVQPNAKDLADGYVRPATVSDEVPKLASVPSPFEAPDDATDEKVLAWWTGVLKKPEPKSGKVTAPMRKQYRSDVLGA